MSAPVCSCLPAAPLELVLPSDPPLLRSSHDEDEFRIEDPPLEVATRSLESRFTIRTDLLSALLLLLLPPLLFPALPLAVALVGIP